MWIGRTQYYDGKNAWFDEYDKDMLIKLKVDGILDYQNDCFAAVSPVY